MLSHDEDAKGRLYSRIQGTMMSPGISETWCSHCTIKLPSVKNIVSLTALL